MKKKFIDKMNCTCLEMRAESVHYWGFGKKDIGGCMTFQSQPRVNALIDVMDCIGGDIGIQFFWKG